MKKSLILSGLLLASSLYASKYQDTFSTYVQETPTVSKEYFSNGEYKLYSPAFVKGWSEKSHFTTQKEMMDFLKNIASKHKWATLKSLGKSQDGREIPYMLLSNGKNEKSKIRVWLQGGLHGNEPAGAEGMLALIGDLSKNPKKVKKLLSEMDILILPRVNVDGTAYFQRRTARNIDINRDYVKLEVPELKQKLKVLSEFSPHVIVDNHEYTPHKKGLKNIGEKGLALSHDAYYSGAKNLNMDERLRKIGDDMIIGEVKKALNKEKLSNDYYVWMPGSGKQILNEPGPDARVGRNGMGLTNAVTVLYETRGIGLGMQHYPRRVKAQVIMNETTLNTVLANKKTILATINDSIAKTIENGKYGKEDIIIKSKKIKGAKNFDFLDIAKDKVIQRELPANLSTKQIPVLTRKRPTAYIIPPAFDYVTKKLENWGLSVQRLKQDRKLEVEAFNITENKVSSKLYEGQFRNAVKTQLVKREITFPKGTAIVSMAQKNANIMILALEPESADSLVRFGIIPVQKGDQVPVFRFHGQVK